MGQDRNKTKVLIHKNIYCDKCRKTQGGMACKVEREWTCNFCGTKHVMNWKKKDERNGI